MLLEIDESVIEYASDSPACRELAGAALENVAISYRKGFHLVTGRPAVFRWLYRNLPLGGETKATMRRLEIDAVQTHILCQQFRRFVRIVAPGSGLPRLAVSGSSIHCNIPLPDFRDFDLCNKTILLGENLADAELYHIAGKMALHESGRHGFVVQAERLSGGGRSTDQAIQAIQEGGRRFCICFVDSDKDHPNASLGDTAAAVLRAWNSSHGLVNVTVTRTHELENAIPVELIRTVYSSVRDKIDACGILIALQPTDPEILDYVDLKSGLSGPWILRFPPESPGRAFWTSKVGRIAQVVALQEAPCCGCLDNNSCGRPEKCSCMLIQPLGAEILVDCIKALQSQSSAKLYKRLAYSRDLLEYGRSVWEACCGTAGILV